VTIVGEEIGRDRFRLAVKGKEAEERLLFADAEISAAVVGEQTPGEHAPMTVPLGTLAAQVRLVQGTRAYPI
jgi:hypothetical protein